MDRPPFNDLAQANMSKEAKAIMEYALKKSCDEQAKTMEDYEKRQIRKADKEKSKLDAKETVEFIKEHYGDVLRKLSKT